MYVYDIIIYNFVLLLYKKNRKYVNVFFSV